MWAAYCYSRHSLGAVCGQSVGSAWVVCIQLDKGVNSQSTVRGQSLYGIWGQSVDVQSRQLY